MKLTMLGTGNALVTECYNTCFLIEDRKQWFMTDGGGGSAVLHQIKHAGADWMAIRHIFVTHKHIDHLIGIIWMVRMICQFMNHGDYLGDACIYSHISIQLIDKFRFDEKLFIHSLYSIQLCGALNVYRRILQMDYQDVNAETIDRWVKEGWEWGQPVSHETYVQAQRGKWDLHLSPTKMVPHEWFGEIKGKKVLGLASGGGQQMPIFAALGAECTVMDYSEEQLKSEHTVAEREGYSIRIIRGDMTKRFPFEDEEFDIVFHPVSNCYVEQVKPIWKECFRVLKHGGVLLVGTDHYVNYIVDEAEERIINHLPFNPLKDPEQMRQLQEEDGGVQFSHSLEEQIGGQLEAGFILTNLYEDTNGEGRLAELNIPSFLVMRSVKP